MFFKDSKQIYNTAVKYLNAETTQMPAVLQTANTPITLFSKVDFSFRPALIGTGSTAILSRKSVLVAVGELPAAHRADL